MSNTKWIVVLAASLVLGVLMVGLFGAPLSAQQRPKLLEACKAGGDEVSARDLPSRIEPGQCPTEKVITDGGVGSALPEPGESVYVEALTTTGSQELQISHFKDGTIEFNHVGGDSEEADSAEAQISLAAKGPNECRDRAHTNLSYRVESGFRYYINLGSKPPELTRTATKRAIVSGGTNITRTRNKCGMGDRVPVGTSYAGRTGLSADVSSTGRCRGVDRRNVVSFGSLPKGTLAVTCTYSANSPGYDKVVTSDMKINKTRANWTTNPGSRSCKRKFDLESVVTHERGHTFGLGHVSESKHGNLTMSTRINGPCQASERTLGRGDVLGLDRKY
ncbi:MAG TPA: matrixin family metalloprotease [Rubrobacteraceae bacterium]|nr:matrixin family metalloprotease [Rubrobacteraceae bacterium]